MLLQNFGMTNKEYYGMLWYFLEGSIRSQFALRETQSSRLSLSQETSIVITDWLKTVRILFCFFFLELKEEIWRIRHWHAVAPSFAFQKISNAPPFWITDDFQSYSVTAIVSSKSIDFWNQKMVKTISSGAAHTYMVYIRGYTLPSPLGILAKAKGKDPYFTWVTRNSNRRPTVCS